ncbi:MAG TPA: hypothetical protein EYH34_10660 [Planctomycetes bacterium]|nr:hypothetical protein [Planctomycetota bacterium]
MARSKVVNRKQLREEAEAAQQRDAGLGGTNTPAPAKSTAKKTRSKAPKNVRLKAFWGVFSQSLTAVALFEYSQREQAEKKAEHLTQSKKAPHFVQLVKRVIEE